MKSYDYDAVTFDGACYCTGCLETACKVPEGYEHQQVTLESDEVSPIFADSEWDSYPVCDHCGEKHEYVSLTSDGLVNEAENQNAEIFHVDAATFRNAFDSQDGTWHMDYMNENVEEDDVEAVAAQAAKDLEGYYVWCCLPGCMPDSDASGPFKTPSEAAASYLNL